MKKTHSTMKDALLVRKMKTEDSLELPMDDQFFDQLHQNIMCAVEKTEIKPVKKWQKTWVFLEQQAAPYRARARKAAKLGLAAVTFSLVMGLIHMSFKTYQQAELARIDINKRSIIEEAQKNPLAWSQLVANYENETDFYAEVLSQSDTSTIVQVNSYFKSSL